MPVSEDEIIIPAFRLVDVPAGDEDVEERLAGLKSDEVALGIEVVAFYVDEVWGRGYFVCRAGF